MSVVNPQSPVLNELLAVPGVRLAAVGAGIRYRERADLTVFELCEGAQTAAVFTQNAFCAAPVVVAREHLASTMPRYLLVVAGNANAGTGTAGLAAARQGCADLAALADCSATAVLPFATGVIGEPLPVERVQAALPAAMQGLDAAAWPNAARAIMTTDTVPKGISRRFQWAGETITVTGIAKGAGMLRPDMATMLAFIATDAPVEAALLQECLQHAVGRSFNRITVDGDTSTNDACVLCATGKAPIPAIRAADEGFSALVESVTAVCEDLAQALVRDGEGATKFITVDVQGGRDAQECLQVGYTVAHSPLVKTAFFASDPNWGRILAAIGRAGLPGLDVEAVQVYLNEVCIVDNGARAPAYTEAAGQAVMAQTDITIAIKLARGSARERLWTTDLSHDYVRINAEYRS